MKRLLINLVTTLSNYLNKIASLLDSRFRYFHIDLLPTATAFKVTYDSKDTLDAMLIYEESGGVNTLLKGFGAKSIESIKIMKEEIGKISEGDIIIAWEHYATNYIDNPKVNILDDDDLVDFNGDNEDDNDDEMDVEDISGGLIRLGILQQKPPHFTPWGKFDYDNPLSPTKMYDLRMVHFKGFTTKSFPDFSKLMDSIEGIAIWGKIDPYRIILGPAKSYSYAEIKHNFESAIYTALGKEFKDGPKGIEDYVIEIGEASKNLFLEGTENYTIIFPEPNFSVEVIEGEKITEKTESEINKLLKQIEDLIVFKNGEFYECE